jgi:DNA polymerase
MSKPGSVREQVRARLLDLARDGVDGLPRLAPVRRPAREAPPAPSRAAPAPAAPPSVELERRAGWGQASILEAAEAEAPWKGLGLEALGAFLSDCTRCKLSGLGRTQVVFGVGNPTARLMFVGEAPGHEEDLRGEPFVGKAGQLLTEMIEKGMGLRRQDVYIANVIKCRPPGNRDPEPDEVASCEGFLRRQIALVKPEVLVGLGRVAVQSLLKTTTRIGLLRGKWHEYEGTPLMATFHPAYLLRNPGDKRAAWEDLKLVMARLGLPRA